MRIALLVCFAVMSSLPLRVGAQNNSTATMNNLMPQLQNSLNQAQAAAAQAQQSAQIEQQNSERARAQAAAAAQKRDDAMRSSAANPFASGNASNGSSTLPSANNPFASPDRTAAPATPSSQSDAASEHHSSTHGPTTGPRLVIGTDVACSVRVDDGNSFDVYPDVPFVIKAAIGDHLVTAVTRDGKATWHTAVSIEKPTSKAVVISFAGQRLASQGAQSVVQAAAAAQQKMHDTAARAQQQAQVVAARTQSVAADREEKRKQIADIQSQINDLREEQEADREAAQNMDAQAQLSQQQCTNLPAGVRCYGSAAGSVDQVMAMQKRQEAQRLQLQINELQTQLQFISTQ